MSAIAGLTRLDGRPLDTRELLSAIRSLAHRGDIAKGIWSSHNVGAWPAAHLERPEFPRKTPLESDNHGHFILAADARLDNRNELRSALGWAADTAPEATDEDLITEAYTRWGVACPEKLLGDFAFALWDPKKKAWFCARDPLGVKPFYYYHRAGVLFIFASEVQSILKMPDVRRCLNEERVADHLLSTAEDKESTFYKDIRRLPPGHWMTAGHDGITIRRYWSLDRTREVHYGCDEEYVAAFRTLFADAVHCRLRGNGPIGAVLSGGLDSSAVTCMARDLLAKEKGKALFTFSTVFTQPVPAGDGPFVNAVLDQGGVDSCQMQGDHQNPLAAWWTVLHRLAEAPVGGHYCTYWAVYEAAHAQGVKVLLDGLDGDSTLSHGQGCLSELAFAGHWIVLKNELDALVNTSPLLSRRALLRNEVLKPLVPDWLHGLCRTLQRSLHLNSPPHVGLLNPDFARRTGAAKRWDKLNRAFCGPPRSAREAHWRVLVSGWQPYTLEFEGHAAAALGLELRHPFYDRRLVEFCLALPARFKLRQGQTRSILRDSLADLLPDAVRQRRTKSRIGSTLARQLLAIERPLLEKVFVKEPGVIAPYVSLPELRVIYDRFVRDASVKDLSVIWRVLSLALWLQAAGFVPE